MGPIVILRMGSACAQQVGKVWDVRDPAMVQPLDLNASTPVNVRTMECATQSLVYAHVLLAMMAPFVRINVRMAAMVLVVGWSVIVILTTRWDVIMLLASACVNKTGEVLNVQQNARKDTLALTAPRNVTVLTTAPAML